MKKKIELVITLVSREYFYFTIDPLLFLLVKIENTIKNYLNKTQEQKIILFVTVGFLVLDLVIIESDSFDLLAIFKFFPNLWLSEKWNIYFSFLSIQSLLKLIILSYFNINNFWQNFKTALPYFGGFYGFYFFIFSNKKKP